MEIAAKGMHDLWLFLLGDERINRVVFESLSAEYAVADVERVQPADQALRFRELSQRITTAQLEHAPPWFREGLAEYYALLEVRGPVSLVKANGQYMEVLSKARPPSLDDLFSLDDSAWHEGGDPPYSMQAWSLIYFLLQSRHGRYALQDMVRWAEDNPENGNAMIVALDRAYPGGLVKLERDWHEWMVAAPLNVARLSRPWAKPLL